MTWVLWDILVPLLTSFALGMLLSWLVWRRQYSFQGMTAEPAGMMSGGMAFDSSSASVKEIEKANNVLIGERDKATMALEEMQTESQSMKDRIAELEAINTDQDKKLSQTTAVLPGDMIAHEDNTQELERARDELNEINETLNAERKARRATELELLNTKNRHEKLAAQLPAGISEEQHNQEIDKRELQIEDLKRQLDEKAAKLVQAESRLESVSAEKVVEEPAQKASLDQIETRPAAKKAVIKNGYTPTGWSVPELVPSKEETDKLTVIKGIGPVLEKILHEYGIFNFHQIANLDDKGMDELQELIPEFPGRIQRDRWVEQAQELVLETATDD